ncbi:MAG TPA: FliM/FliN family flagellar motor switch protein [Steroidobacteraceae bacterium]|jgi:flagellar motor switch protein FliM|nr:FliM/FliN family flagellar motor switch protein [Steroidobacteraceae bacterium]
MGGEAARAAAGASNAISPEEVSALLERNRADTVRPYDFAAQRINRTQLPMLEIIAKSFAERATGSLSGLLGRDANVQFSSIESVRAVDLQPTLPMPASVAVVRLKPLAGFAFVCVDPSLLLALLDGFFGGSGRAATDAQAAIAPAAQRFLALLLRSMSADFTAAWTPVSPLELELVKQEINPRLLQLGGPQDSLIVAKFNVEFGARSGRIDWLLPENVLAPIREALVSDGGKPPARKQEAWAPELRTALQDAMVETRAILTQAQISLRELVRLTPGDIIPIEAPQHVTLLAGEVPLYRGRFGVSQGRNALKIIPGGSA